MRFRPFQFFCAAVTLGVLCFATSGCALFGAELDKAAEGAGKLVTFYCENITSEEIRTQFRAAVNQHAAPHSVSVACAQGGTPLIVNPDNGTAAPVPPTSDRTTRVNDMPSTNPYEIARMKARDEAVAKAAEVAADLNPDAIDVEALQHENANLRQARDLLESECKLLNQRIQERDAELSTVRAECAGLRAELARLTDPVNASHSG